MGEVLVCTECRATFDSDEARLHPGSRGRPEGGGFAESHRGSATWTCTHCANVNPRDAASCLRCGEVG
jgi:ribosomal protein L40E